MTATFTRPPVRLGAVLFAGLVAAALWLPTLAVPVDSPLTADPIAIELA